MKRPKQARRADSQILKSKIGGKPLSERELEIGRFLMGGLSDNEIARKIFISPDTVKFHLKNIYKKTGIKGRRGLLKKSSINSNKYKNLLNKYNALQKEYLKTAEDLFSERSFPSHLRGTFLYDFKTGLSKPNTWTRLIYFLGKNCPFDYGKEFFTFEEVKSLVEPKDRQRFQNACLDSRKKRKISTDTIHLVNGNAIVEEYNYIYHSEDYEMRSPIRIEGETKLISIAD